MPVAVFVLVISIMTPDGKRLDYVTSKHASAEACVSASANVAQDDVVQITRPGVAVEWGCVMCALDGCTVIASSIAEINL